MPDDQYGPSTRRPSRQYPKDKRPSQDRFPGGFTQFPNELPDGMRLTSNEHWLLFAICSFSWNTRICTQSNEELARRCQWISEETGNANLTTVKDTLAKLEAKGHIKRVMEMRGGRRQRVHIVVSVPWIDPEATAGPDGPEQGHHVAPNRAMDRSRTGPSGGPEQGHVLRLHPEDPVQKTLLETPESTLFAGHPHRPSVEVLDPWEREAEEAREGLTSDLEKILSLKAGGKRQYTEITRIARWLAQLLGDEQSHERHCQYLWRVARGELPAGYLVYAFQWAYVDQTKNEVANPAAAYFSTIDSCVRRANTDAEIVAEDNASPLPQVESRPADDFEPIPTATPASEHWFDARAGQVMSLLKDRGFSEDDLRHTGERVQTVLAGRYSGKASARFLELVEAVSFDYPLEHVRAWLASVPKNYSSGGVEDVRESIRDLDPNPRLWLKDNVAARDRVFGFSYRQNRSSANRPA